MFGFRTKRVTDPLDDEARARIIGKGRVDPYYVSSGSEHSAEAFDDVTDSSLSELVFFDDDGGDLAATENNDSGSDRDQFSIVDSSAGNPDSAEPIVAVFDATDEYRNALESHVSHALRAFSGGKSEARIVRRSVAAYLRSRGYNAAVCKTKWESGGGITAGSHEFIDVLSDDAGGGARYFVDLEFAPEFEIARPTGSYERFLGRLPAVFVGKSADLKRILKAASAAARRSLRSAGLHLPPWRKHRFIQNKWLGSYRRTTNLLPARMSYGAVQCRAVGFVAAGDGGRLVLPARDDFLIFVFRGK